MADNIIGLRSKRVDSITDISVTTTVSAFIAISWYNVLAINLVILLLFKRWSGLYFYSLMIASWGIVLHQLGYLMQFFGIVDKFVEHYVIMMVGWYTMTTGQAVVLYSRIHLITRDKRRFRWVLYMIIANALCFHVPTTILLALTDTRADLIPPYKVWQNIQVTAFSIQEFILAGLYIYEAHRVLKPSREFRKAKVRQVMRNLIHVNILVIILDIAVMCTQYAGFYEVHVVFKGAVYGVKLFVEFFVLNQLTELTGPAGLTGSSDADPSTTAHGTAIRKRTSIHISRADADGEGGYQQDYYVEGNAGGDSPVDTTTKSQVSENDTSRLVTDRQPPGEYQDGEHEQSHAGSQSSGKDTWIELS